MKAFISYRRQDSYLPLTPDGEQDLTFMITLETALNRAGFEEVFIDTGAIRSGENYESRIHKEISESDLFVAVIGNKWSQLLAERKASPGPDMLAHEIRASLRLEKEIVPILVDGAKMPQQGDLPEEIRQFHFQNGFAVKSTDSADEIAESLVLPSRRVTQVRRLDARWTRAYFFLAGIAWLCCAVLPNVIGLAEFGPSWGAMAAIWSGFFIWPIFFLPFALIALYRPILVLIESSINAVRLRDRLVYVSPLVFGTVLAGLGIAIELKGQETPWSIHPALPDCAVASQASSLHALSHYDEPKDPELNRDYGREFWMKDKCWPNVFYYLTVPLYQNKATPDYLVRRPAVATEFISVLERGESHSKVFYSYVLSFTILMWFLGTGVVMSIFYVMVQIRRPDDDSILRLPSEVAYLCLTYTFVTMTVWIPFRINTDYFKYLYYCGGGQKCDGILRYYFTDIVLAAALLFCYVFLSVGLIYKYQRLALGLLGALSVGTALLLAFLVYWFRESLVLVTDSWQFAVGASILIILGLVALGYRFDPSIVYFNDFRKNLK